jgi:hypothetical protein
MTSTEAQQRLFGILKEYNVRLNDSGRVEQGEAGDMFILSKEPGDTLSFGENGRYKVTGIAPNGDTRAGLVLRDTQTNDRIAVHKKGHAPEKHVDFFSSVTEKGKASSDLIKKISDPDINQAGLFLIPMFEETLGIEIPRDGKVGFIQALNKEASKSGTEMTKDIQAVIASAKSLDAEVVDRVLAKPDQYLFKTLLLVRKAISDKKNPQQAFNSLQNFARNLKKLIKQNKSAHVEQPEAEAKPVDYSKEVKAQEIVRDIFVTNAESRTGLFKDLTPNFRFIIGKTDLSERDILNAYASATAKTVSRANDKLREAFQAAVLTQAKQPKSDVLRKFFQSPEGEQVLGKPLDILVKSTAYIHGQIKNHVKEGKVIKGKEKHVNDCVTLYLKMTDALAKEIAKAK